ncbi:two-component system nitrate/nitrite response regulator NarL [Sphingomonas zeicaulis]|uniref:LuxR C-terminal-related transcriptional regulator n=1 Tax=Sphingomonas zeicaulis TaxID=1632740 RepID=UPI003D19473B
MDDAPVRTGPVAGDRGAAILIMRNALMREGLHRILRDDGYAGVLAGAEMADFGKFSWTREHLVILDSGTFDAGGFDSIRDANPVLEMPRFVVIADELDIERMFRVFAAGGRGYLCGGDSYKSFLIKLALVRLDEKVMPSAFLDTLSGLPRLERTAAPELWDPSALDTRGQAVLAGLVQGMSNKTIAHELCLSELTVKLAVRAVLRKLQVSNRTQAAITARGCKEIHLAWKHSCGLKLSGPRGV